MDKVTIDLLDKLDQEHDLLIQPREIDRDMRRLARIGLNSLNENMCDACAGTGTPISGLACMCRGTGKLSEAAYYLREQLYKSHVENDNLSAIVKTCQSLIDGYRKEL